MVDIVEVKLHFQPFCNSIGFLCEITVVYLCQIECIAIYINFRYTLIEIDMYIYIHTSREIYIYIYKYMNIHNASS